MNVSQTSTNRDVEKGSSDVIRIPYRLNYLDNQGNAKARTKHEQQSTNPNIYYFGTLYLHILNKDSSVPYLHLLTIIRTIIYSLWKITKENILNKKTRSSRFYAYCVVAIVTILNQKSSEIVCRLFSIFAEIFFRTM